MCKFHSVRGFLPVDEVNVLPRRPVTASLIDLVSAERPVNTTNLVETC